MNRTGLIVALAIAAVAGLAFGLYPQLDLRIAHISTTTSTPPATFSPGAFNPPLMLARDIGLWIGALLVAPAVAALMIKLSFRAARCWSPAARLCF